MRHFLILFFYCPILMMGQISDYSIKNFTIADGLPSNECHGTLQDSLGYIWIATDRGLVKFDGSKFTTYGVSKGLEDISVLSIIMDIDQSIYISTYSKRIYKYLPAKDSIVRFEFDYLLAPYVGKANFSIVRHISIDSIYIDLFGIGLFSMDTNGKELKNVNSIESAFNLNYYKEKLLISNNRYFSSFNSLKFGKYQIEIDTNIPQIHLPTSFNLNKERLFFCIYGKRYFLEKNLLKKKQEGNAIFYIFNQKDGSFLSAQIFKQGVKYYPSYEDLKNDKFVDFIPNVSASHIFKDRQENLFISTTDSGLFYLKKNSVRKLNSKNLHKADIRNLIQKDNISFFMIYDERNLISYNTINENWEEIGNAGFELSDIEYDFKRNRLLISSDYDKNYFGVYKVKRIFDESNLTVNIKKIIWLQNESLLVLTSSFILIYDRLNNKVTYTSKNSIPIIRVETGSNFIGDKLLLGAIDGLYLLENKIMTKLDSIHPVFGSRINEIIKYNNKFYMATLGNGVVIWDGKKEIKIVNESDGLQSNNVESIYVDSKGLIYACSNAGLSIIKNINGAYKFYNLTSHHGLPANQVREVMEVGGKLYIATSSGLCLLSDLPGSSESIAPLIEEVNVNDFTYSPGHFPTTLKYNENNISISFKALDISMLGDNNYRISTNEKKWTQIKETNATFLDLPHGDHQFFIQAENRDGQWSSSTIYNVKILPAWWQTIYFKLGILGVLTFIIYLIFVRRIHQLRKVNELQKEVFKLERSALAAQMNPHFIFNSLNSIQNYIITHDKETAMDYLGQFAKLIRLNLKGSIEEKVSLDNEIRLLKYYLNLEQMRFNHSFNYAIDVDEKLDTNDIKIPPLLIQPFVENAVLHGIQHMTSGGFITVAFSKNANQLMVLVADNGQGIRPESTTKHHQSYGMSITKKRLEKINTLSNYTYSTSSRNGQPGTEVRIIIEI